MDLTHPDIKDAGGNLAGGGVSIYYSHTLQMLFASYAQGKAFMAPLSQVVENLPTVFAIQVINRWIKIYVEVSDKNWETFSFIYYQRFNDIYLNHIYVWDTHALEALS